MFYIKLWDLHTYENTRSIPLDMSRLDSQPTTKYTNMTKYRQIYTGMVP